MDAWQLRKGLIEYLEGVIEKPGKSVRFFPLGKNPAELFVTPQIEFWWAIGNRFNVPLPENWDVFGYYYHFDKTARKDSLEERWTDFQDRGGRRWCVVTGHAGFGKSLLLEMTAAELARIGKQLLEKCDLHSGVIPSIPLPLAVPFPFLAERANAESICSVIHAWLKSKSCDPIVATYLVEQVRTKQSFLILPGLDEVCDAQLRNLQVVLGVLAGWDCTLITTSRPHSLERVQSPSRMQTWSLLAFRERQIDDFLGKWFAGAADTHRVEQLRRAAKVSAAIGDSPFLLTLLCQFSETVNLEERITAGQLVRRAIDFTVGPAQDDTPLVRWHSPQTRFLLAAEIAFEHFNNTGGRGAISPETLRRAASSKTFRLPLSGNSQAAIRGLVEKRLLVPSESDPDQYVFTDGIFTAYLAALALARRIEDDSQIEDRSLDRFGESPCLTDPWMFVGRKAKDPDWEDVIVFLAGTLNDSAELLDRLIDSDDTPDHRHLTLAGRCLGELSVAKIQAATERLLDSIARIRSKILAMWGKSMSLDNELPRLVVRALRAVACCFPDSTATVVLPFLRDEKRTSFGDILPRLFAAGPAVLTAPVVHRLFEILPKLNDSEATVLRRLWEATARGDLAEIEKGQASGLNSDDKGAGSLSSTKSALPDDSKKELDETLKRLDQLKGGAYCDAMKNALKKFPNRADIERLAGHPYIAKAVRAMRAKLIKDADRDKKTPSMIKGVRKQDGVLALDILEALGEYKGHRKNKEGHRIRRVDLSPSESSQQNNGLGESSVG